VATSLAEEAKEGRDVQITRSGRGQKNQGGKEGKPDGQRFFLSKSNGHSGPVELGTEFATEPQAIVESLKTGLSYFSVLEWRGIADLSGKKPQLKKEVVPRAQKSS
jgi:hypothetical protein